MRGPRGQQGLTFISWVVVLAIGGFFITLLMRLGPVYLENYQVKSVLANVEKNRQGETPAQVKEAILNGFYINEVRRLAAKDVKLFPSAEGLTVQVEYEVRVPIMGNVDAVVSFDEILEMPNP